MTELAEIQKRKAMEINFMDNSFVLDPSGCLYWREESLLVVSDLHLEKGSSYAVKKSLFIPPYDTQATLETLALRILDWQPKTVISLGDSFHDEDAATRLPNSYKQHLSQLMQGRDWIWVSGNHDPSPPKDLGGTFCEEIHIGNLNFCHEPKLEFKAGEIAGHLHPSARIRQRGKSIRRRCFIADEKRMIMPAFGSFTGGLNVLDEAYSDLFNRHDLNCWMLSGDQVFEIPHKKLVR